jgi:hypothetical protein
MALSTYIKVAAAAFVGKLLAVIFVAISVLIGLGPDKWASFLLEGFPSWVTPGVLRTAALILAVSVLVQLVWPLLSRAIDLLPIAENRTRIVMLIGLALLACGVLSSAVGVKLIYAASNVSKARIPSEISRKVETIDKLHKILDVSAEETLAAARSIPMPWEARPSACLHRRCRRWWI